MIVTSERSRRRQRWSRWFGWCCTAAIAAGTCAERRASTPPLSTPLNGTVASIASCRAIATCTDRVTGVVTVAATGGANSRRSRDQATSPVTPSTTASATIRRGDIGCAGERPRGRGYRCGAKGAPSARSSWACAIQTSKKAPSRSA